MYKYITGIIPSVSCYDTGTHQILLKFSAVFAASPPAAMHPSGPSHSHARIIGLHMNGLLMNVAEWLNAEC